MINFWKKIDGCKDRNRNGMDEDFTRVESTFLKPHGKDSRPEV
jgi:hypothetical protein